MKILILILILLSFVCSAGEVDLNLQQIIERHTKAVGGKDAIESAKSLQIALQIEEPTFRVDAIYKVTRERRMRIDIFSQGKRVYTEAYDGTNGWEMGEDGIAKDSSAEGTSALWHGIVFPDKLFGFHEQESLGNHVKFDGRQNVDGMDYYVLDLTLSDGFNTQYYINPETWLVDRTRDTEALHPDLNASKVFTETRNSDYRIVDGVMRSFKSVKVDLKSGSVLQTTTVSEIKTNPAIDESIFKKPPH